MSYIHVAHRKKEIHYNAKYRGREIDCCIHLLGRDPAGVMFRIRYANVSQIMCIGCHDWGKYLVIPQIDAAAPLRNEKDYAQNYECLTEILPARDARVIAQGIALMEKYILPQMYEWSAPERSLAEYCISTE